MKKKNLKVQVAALAMTGAIAAIPMTAMAEETNTTVAPTEVAVTNTGGNEAAALTSGEAPVVAVAEAVIPAAAEAETVTVEEAAVDPGTTAPNNVNTVQMCIRDRYRGITGARSR